tara:strand:+ start:290 stop:466 length:177 start_codon:yes stop_codon:yes gene_type:complete
MGNEAEEERIQQLEEKVESLERIRHMEWGTKGKRTVPTLIFLTLAVTMAYFFFSNSPF